MKFEVTQVFDAIGRQGGRGEGFNTYTTTDNLRSDTEFTRLAYDLNDKFVRRAIFSLDTTEDNMTEDRRR